MSMPLMEDITLREVREEQERFDYLEGVRGYVWKAMEFHGDDGDDAEYCYLFWVRNEKEFIARVESNLKDMYMEKRTEGWNYDVNWNGNGLVFVRAFL